MKKMSIIISVMLMGLVGVSQNVSAQEVYYENEKGVVFTKEQYDFFTAMYYDGFQEIMSQEDFDSFKEADMNKENVESKIYREYPVNPMGTEFSSSAKGIKISKAAISNPRIAISLEWYGTPTVKGYDVMGAFLGGVGLRSGVSTIIHYTGGYTNEYNIKQEDNGFGVSMMLPANGKDIMISQTFSVSPGGKVYATYQHAMRSASLAMSQNYTIGYVGFGHVFAFNSGAQDIYDDMQGVDIAV